MHFSVLMAVYCKEAPQRLSRALQSTFEQTVVPDEVVLVKDGPLPNELDVIINEYQLSYPDKMNIIQLKENMGPSHAWRIGLEACKYERVARMDSDDVCLPHRFEIQIRHLERHPEIDVLGGGITEFEDTEDSIYAKRLTPLSHEEIFRYSKRRNPMNHVTVILRRSPVIAAGSFLPFFGYVDYYLWVRMLKRGARFENLPDILVNVHAGRALMVRRGGMKYYHSEIRFYRKLYRMAHINMPEVVYNIGARTVYRFIPINLRKRLYKDLLRC